MSCQPEEALKGSEIVEGGDLGGSNIGESDLGGSSAGESDLGGSTFEGSTSGESSLGGSVLKQLSIMEGRGWQQLVLGISVGW